jgi:hypothetical protein
MRGGSAVGILMLISIMLGTSLDYTQTVDAEFFAKNISNTPTFSSDPQIAVSGNNLYVIWEDFTPGNWEIFFKRTRDNGVKFSSTINLSDNDNESARPQIAVSDNNVYVVWVDFTSENYDIMFRASNDSGASFGNTLNLSKNVGDLRDPKRSDPPRISASGNNVHVVWVYDDAVFLKTSTDNGASFGDAINLSRNTATDGSFARPQIVVSDNNLYVVWIDNKEILFRASNDNGASFGNTVNLSAESKNATAPKRSDLPRIAISDDNVYIVWVDYTPGNYDIMFRASSDNGASFNEVIELSTIAALSDLPHIAASGNHVYVIWDDYNLAEGLDVFLRASTDNGATFGSLTSLIRNTGYTTSTPVAVSGNNVYVISSIGNVDIFLRTSTDNGITFDDAINLSNNVGGSSDPNIAVSGENVYVVWEDYETGNAEVFFVALDSNNVSSNARNVGPMMLSTDNESMKVEVTVDRRTLEPELPTLFTMQFLDPATGEALQHVNYSFTITDENNNVIVKRENLHAHNGMDNQSVTFSSVGSLELAIDVSGVGIEMPYDTSHSGTTSTTLTVVPEFPLGILAMMTAVVAIAVVITRFKNPLLRL